MRINTTTLVFQIKVKRTIHHTTTDIRPYNKKRCSVLGNTTPGYEKRNIIALTCFLGYLRVK